MKKSNIILLACCFAGHILVSAWAEGAADNTSPIPATVEQPASSMPDTDKSNPKAPGKLNSVLVKYDKDKDGKLSKEERDAVIADCHSSFQKRLAERRAEIKKFDLDGDGRLNAKEHELARNARHQKILETYDLDKDGILNKEEVEAMRKDRGNNSQPAR